MNETLFWRKVVKTDGCWEWNGYRNRFGYGIVNHGPHGTRKRERAHRVSWVLRNGEVPKGLFVLHKCDNPPCVNPEHLEIGTKKKNSTDAAIRMRFRTSKLSPDQVRIIRSMKGLFDRNTLASEHGVSPVTISHIWNGHSWRHLS